ncbi:hotdog fold thioesterase [Rothia sp. AR01]|uniref:Hotdog fold thioesterase n=1 Tax=Rothia santali TaxID=2949643 RepID=A0A9X2KK11_9MICC|nr:hotdog fold domain-containing protein [Rothia santali]MCP3424541.1 hotdog fold thioesterase [Rothia santali]
MMGLLGRLGDRDAARGPAGMLAAVGAHELRRRVGRRRGGSGPADLPSPSEIRSARGSALVDPARHADFVRAVSGEPTPHAHGGYLHALTFPVSMRLMASGRFPLSVLGLVHLRNRVEHLRAVEIGTTVHIHSHVLEFGEHRRGTTVTIVAEVWDATGRLAFRDESLYLALGPAPGEGHGEGRAGGRGGSASGGTAGPRRRAGTGPASSAPTPATARAASPGGACPPRPGDATPP